MDHNNLSSSIATLPQDQYNFPDPISGTSRVRGQCKHCGGTFALRRDGQVRLHRAGSDMCKGAGEAPKETISPINPPSSHIDEALVHAADQVAEEPAQAQFTQPVRFKLNDLQREELLAMPHSTSIILDYASRCGKAIRAAISAAAIDRNFDPLVLLKVVLGAAPKHRRSEMRKRRLEAYFSGDLATLLAEAPKNQKQLHETRAKFKRRRNEQNADASAMTALAAGMPGRALRRLGQTGTLSATAETITALEALHPQEDDPNPCPHLENSTPIVAKQVAHTLRSMRQSAPGPSGLRADHLLLAYPAGVSNSLITVLNLICNGSAPAWLADAKLFALPKKSGGVRPIAVGETLRRLASSALLRSSMSTLPPLCRQFVMKLDGCVTVASITRSAIESDKSCCFINRLA